MSDTNTMTRTLPELPFTTALEPANLIWIHQESDLTDRRTTLEGLFNNVFTILPKSHLSFNIGSSSRQFSNVYAAHVTIGDQTISELDGVLQIPDSAITGSLTINGDLTVLGTTTEISSETVTIQDNTIQLNSEQTGTPPVSLESGIEVNRGTETNYRFIFAEDSDTFRIGEAGNLQPVATREDVPIDGGVAVWNASTHRFETATDTGSNAATASRLLNARTISLSGDLVGSASFDGSANVSIEAEVLNDSHNHDTRYYTKDESNTRFVNVDENDIINADLTVNGTITTNTVVATLSGNASTASKLLNTRQISFTGDVTGSQYFSGESDITISLDVLDDSHTHNTIYYTKAEADARYLNSDGDSVVGNLTVADDGSGTAGVVTAASFVGPLTGNVNGNATSASQWETPRSITLDGDASGTVVLDGLADKILTVTINNNSHNHDAQYYTQDQADARFINVDGDDVDGDISVTGTVTSNGGFIGDVDGNAATASSLAQAQALALTGGVSGAIAFDGSAPVEMAVTVTDNSHSHESANISDAASIATPDVLVLRDASGNFAGNIISASEFVGGLTGNVTGDVTGNVTGNLVGNVTGNVTGNADTASALQTTRTISVSGDATGSVDFNGASDVDIALTVDPTQHDHDTRYYLQENTYSKVEADNTFLPLSGGTLGGVLNVGASIYIIGGSNKLYGTATQADRLSGNMSISIGGSGGAITGLITNSNGTLLGSGSLHINDVTNNTGGNFIVHKAAEIQGDLTVDNALTTDTLSVTAGATVGGDLAITGNLTVQGSTTAINTTDLEVEDSVIYLNKGWIGNPSAIVSGLEIDRGGAYTNYQFVLSNDTFKIGLIGELQAVATREDSPIDNGVAVWNAAENRFDTTTAISAKAATAGTADQALGLVTPQTISIAGDGEGSVTIGGNDGDQSLTLTVSQAANAVTANQANTLATARNIALTGVVTGDVDFNGSGNVVIATTAGQRILDIESDIATNAANIATNGTDLGALDTRVSQNETKLSGIEDGATADQTGAEIKALYEAELNTNAFTDAERSKLAGIENNANAYVHPASHDPSIIAQDANNRFVTDTQISTWDNKAETSELYKAAVGQPTSLEDGMIWIA